MKRLWAYFTRIDLGYWLLLCVSLNLFAGVIISMLYEDEFKRLNTMLMPEWFHTVSDRPVLYLWLITLIVFLGLLACNTLICTSSYVKAVLDKKCLRKKLGIILFHIAFAIALAGHGISEFWGLNETVTLEQGKSVAVPGTGLMLEVADIHRSSVLLNGMNVRMGMDASLNVRAGTGTGIPLHVQALHPRLFRSYALHLSFMDMGLEENQIRVVVRRDYGLFFILAGGMIAFLAIVLYIPAVSLSRK